MFAAEIPLSVKTSGMFKSYITISFRNLRKNSNNTVINVVGLAISISACLFIYLITKFESSFDDFHKNTDRIFRVVSEIKRPEGDIYVADVPYALPQGLRIDYPQLEKVSAIYGDQNTQVSVMDNNNNVSNKKFKEDIGVFWADPAFFEMFNFKWLSGSPHSSLAEPNTAALTKETAEKYFGNWQDAIGRTIQLNNKEIFKITGIINTIPSNSDFPLKVVVSYSTFQKADFMNEYVGMRGGSYCFVTLPAGYSANRFNNDLREFVKRHKPAQFQFAGHIVQPLREMHFDGRFGNYNQRTFGKELISTLILIAVFLLIIACVNFINLATARAVSRSKEVGIRKVLGSNRTSLVLQFLGETALVALGAVVVAIGITQLALPYIRNLLNIPISMNVINNWQIIPFLIIVILSVTVLAGFYPAFILSGFKPITALKNKITSRMTGTISLRRGLVVFQFIIAQALIIGTLVVVSQMRYFNNAQLGFEKDSIINVPIPDDDQGRSKANALRLQLLEYSGIKSASLCIAPPIENGGHKSAFRFDHSDKLSDFDANLKWADTAYFNTYKMKLAAGRLYSQADTVREFVVNECLLRKLGIRDPQEAIGKQLNLWDGTIIAPIVGVVKDFSTTSLKDPIEPVIMGTRQAEYRMLGVKLGTDNLHNTLNYISAIWAKTYPQNVYEYQFMDDKIASFYKQEKQLAELYKLFAIIAISISCFGLYGLVSFMATQRVKELGIRKILGASIGNIIYLFAREFTLLVSIAFIIASPIAYLFMNRWLQQFAFRIDLGVTIFLITGLSSLAITWLVVGYKVIKVAFISPVKRLRTE